MVYKNWQTQTQYTIRSWSINPKRTPFCQTCTHPEAKSRSLVGDALSVSCLLHLCHRNYILPNWVCYPCCSLPCSEWTFRSGRTCNGAPLTLADEGSSLFCHSGTIWMMTTRSRNVCHCHQWCRGRPQDERHCENGRQQDVAACPCSLRVPDAICIFLSKKCCGKWLLQCTSGIDFHFLWWVGGQQRSGALEQRWRIRTLQFVLLSLFRGLRSSISFSLSGLSRPFRT